MIRGNEMETVYKAVRITHDGKYFSLRRGIPFIVYNKEKKILPEIGYIYCFRTCEDAVRHCKRNHLKDIEIWECKGQVVNIPAKRFCLAIPYSKRNYDLVKKFWRDYQNMNGINIRDCPKGTILCSSLKFVSTVFEDKEEENESL
jgi:hypothetical protein